MLCFLRFNFILCDTRKKLDFFVARECYAFSNVFRFYADKYFVKPNHNENRFGSLCECAYRFLFLFLYAHHKCSSARVSSIIRWQLKHLILRVNRLDEISFSCFFSWNFLSVMGKNVYGTYMQSFFSVSRFRFVQSPCSLYCWHSIMYQYAYIVIYK